jgi:hypothetical protein
VEYVSKRVASRRGFNNATTCHLAKLKDQSWLATGILTRIGVKNLVGIEIWGLLWLRICLKSSKSRTVRERGGKQQDRTWQRVHDTLPGLPFGLLQKQVRNLRPTNTNFDNLSCIDHVTPLTARYATEPHIPEPNRILS